MLGMVFLSNGLLQALYRSQNSSCPMAVKSSLVVNVIVVTHTHEMSFVGQTLHLGAPNAWPNVCSPSYRPRSRHERKSQAAIKVAKSQWPQQRSASVHSLLTPDSEIYQEGNPQWGYLTTLVPMLRRVGVFSWNWRAFSFLSLPPVAVEVVNVALAEALREFWYLASQVLLLWRLRLSLFASDSWPWVWQKPAVSSGRSKADRCPIRRESALSHPAESRGVAGNSFSAFCALRIIAPPSRSSGTEAGGKGIQNQLLAFAHLSKGLFKISFFIKARGHSPNIFIPLRDIHLPKTVLFRYSDPQKCVRSWTCIASCAEIRKMDKRLGSACLTGRELGRGSWALASANP